MSAALLAMLLTAEPVATGTLLARGNHEVGAGVAGFMRRNGLPLAPMGGVFNVNAVYGFMVTNGFEARALVGFLHASAQSEHGINHARGALQALYHWPLGRLALTAGVGLVGSVGEDFFVEYPDPSPSALPPAGTTRVSSPGAQAGALALVGVMAEPLPHLVLRANLRVELTPFRLLRAVGPDGSEWVPTVLLELEVATWR